MTTETTQLTHWTNGLDDRQSEHMAYRLVMADSYGRDRPWEGLMLVGIDGGGVERLRACVDPSCDNSGDGQAIVDALWCHTEAHSMRPGDITGLCHILSTAVEDCDDDWSLREMLVDALKEVSDPCRDTPSDSCGVCESDGDQIAWWHNGGYSQWRHLSDCDDDQRSDLGIDD